MIEAMSLPNGEEIEVVQDDQGVTTIATITVVNHNGNPNAQVTIEKDPHFDFVDITCTSINPDWFATYVTRQPCVMDQLTSEQFYSAATAIMIKAIAHHEEGTL